MKIDALIFSLFLCATVTLSAQKATPTPASLAPSSGAISDQQAELELARVLRDAKRYDESTVHYQTLLAAGYETSVVRQELAQILFWQGKTVEATTLLQAVPAADLTIAGKLTLIDLQIGAKQYEPAETGLREILKTQPEELSARLRLAEILSWTKKLDAALEQYRLILAARPEDKQVRRKYATVLGWAGRPEEAAAELQKTLK